MPRQLHGKNEDFLNLLDLEGFELEGTTTSEEGVRVLRTLLLFSLL